MTRDPIEPPDSADDLVKSRTASTLLGAVAGLALAVWVIAHGDAAITARGGLVIVGGILFGALVGFDLYTTRHWSGRLALLVRLTGSCSAAAALTGLCGRLAGVVTRDQLADFGLGGAVLGLMLWLSIVLDRSP